MYTKSAVPGAVGLSPGEASWNDAMTRFNPDAEKRMQEEVQKQVATNRGVQSDVGRVQS